MLTLNRGQREQAMHSLPGPLHPELSGPVHIELMPAVSTAIPNTKLPTLNPD